MNRAITPQTATTTTMVPIIAHYLSLLSGQLKRFGKLRCQDQVVLPVGSFLHLHSPRFFKNSLGLARLLPVPFATRVKAAIALPHADLLMCPLLVPLEPCL
jgi:hypothetical protein